MSFVALMAAMTLVGAACGQGGDGGGGEEAPQGGIYRIGTDSFEFTGGFDPSAEYLGTAWSYYTNLLLRTLVTYKHIAGPEGNELVPDLAEAVPEPSDDGLTYEFTLKEGVKFGPPLSRDITTDDILYAFERIGTESVAAQYATYYNNPDFGAIEGLAEFSAGDADDISGIEVVDERTMRFTLNRPTGDFLLRLAMPATAPVPREVGECFEKAGEYGRYVIASGPYMIAGSDELDASSCDTMEELSGFDPTRLLEFERNPDYDEGTDDAEVRESNVDGVTIEINPNVTDIFDKIRAGEYDGSPNNPEAPVTREYTTNPELEDQIHVNGGDRTWYITMNLALAPFDDIHVRKAANLVMDKAGLLQAWGGPTAGAIATHIMPPEMTGGTPTAEEYDPYPTEGFSGDVEAAKEEMRQSEYDSDGDGVCDAPECEDVLHVTANTPPWTQMTPVIESSFEEIGITLRTREFEDAYTPIQTVAENIPVASRPGWGKDYADAFTFVGYLFSGVNIIPEGNTNYSLVGLTPEIAEGLEGFEPDTTTTPSVDEDINRCATLLDQERVDCWIELDKKLMEEVVPWVPYLHATNIDIIGPAVTQWDYDQFSGEAALSKVAVDTNLQVG